MKIKDNVDLKELEKFEFKYDEWYFDHEYGLFPKIYIKEIWRDDKWSHRVIIIINTKDRFIDIRTGKNFRRLTSKQAENKYLSDLIKSGLVEKVKE